MTHGNTPVRDSSRRLLQVTVIGGGAAGFFAAITCAEAMGENDQVMLLERGPQFLQKVKISGGGRCNVTHACFDPKAFTERYPRGARELIGAFHRFQADDTVKWFAARGVALKTEADGRMFPTTVQCLMKAAADAGIVLRANAGVERVERLDAGSFKLTLTNGETLFCERLVMATGGCRSESGGALAVALGHTLAPPVPSLFTFHIKDARLDGISGLAVEAAEVSVPGTKLRERGPVLVTHWGLSGPAILRLSAWGARELHALDYRFTLRVNWLDGQSMEQALSLCQRQRETTGARQVANAAPAGLPARLWEKLVEAVGIPREMKWSQLDRARLQSLAKQLVECEFAVTGKSLNKDEFVTCGGVKLNEVNFKTMESRVCPGLYFAGELLDIDGITGGFNFQAAWTTGWIAGNAMAESQQNRQTAPHHG
jgi:predicted Rossmann fold flavoprotein